MRLAGPPPHLPPNNLHLLGLLHPVPITRFFILPYNQPNLHTAASVRGKDEQMGMFRAMT